MAKRVGRPSEKEKETTVVAGQLISWALPGGKRDKFEMLSADDLKDLRQFLSNRRAYAAATSALKGAAVWIVAIAAGISVMWGGFAEAVKAAFHAGAAK